MGILWREIFSEFKEKPCQPWNKIAEEDAHTQCNVIFTFLQDLLLACEHSLLSVSYRDLLLSPKPPGGQELDLKYFLLHYNSIIKCSNIYCSERMNLVNISDTCRKQYQVSLRECGRWLRVIWWQWLLHQTKGNLGAEIKRRTSVNTLSRMIAILAFHHELLTIDSAPNYSTMILRKSQS